MKNLTVSERKTKLVILKLSSLSQQLRESEDIYHLANHMVTNIYKEKHGTPSNNTNKDKQESVNTNITKPGPEQRQRANEEESEATDVESDSKLKNIDPKMKKIFKDIAIKAHPDKLLNVNNEEEKLKKNNLFLKAHQALDNQDLISLIEVASILGVAIPDLTNQDIKLIEEKIKTIKEQIDKIESTILWNWFFEPEESRKQMLLSKLLELMFKDENNTGT